MIYMDAAKLSDLIGTEHPKRFCNRAGVSSQVLYRLLHHGGPVKEITATKVCTALGAPLESLLDWARTPAFTEERRTHSERPRNLTVATLESDLETSSKADTLTSPHVRNTR